MLSLTRKSDYALVALVYLGHRWHQPAGPSSARSIAETFDMPLPLLMNVLKELASSGLVRSTRGATGGYELGRDPRKIELRQVLHAVEGGDEPAPGDTGCWQVLARLHDRIDRLLEQMSLQDLLDETDYEPGQPLVRLTTPAPSGAD
ncbi:MAG: RrF2 family transcriptional regulator [Phycisphaeraceae bacterium]